MSRTKSKENKFIKLGTKPDQYEPNHRRMIVSRRHCELCGQAITYCFFLKHKDDESKSLFVGSDCIINYIRAYVPNIMELMIQKMEMEMEALIDEHKAKVFADSYPNFKATMSELYVFVRKNLPRELRYRDRAFPLIDDLASAERDFGKKKYVSETTADELTSWWKKISSGEFLELIDEHHKVLDSNMRLSSQREDENLSEFFSHYDKYSHFMGWSNKKKSDERAMSKLEMSTYLRKQQTYLRGMKIRKTKLRNNSDEIMDKLRASISEVISIRQMSEYEMEIISQYMEQKDREEFIKNRPSYFSVDCIKFRNDPYQEANRILEDYRIWKIKAKLDNVKSILMEKIQGGELINEDAFLTGNKYVLFRSMDSAIRAKEKIVSDLSSMIEDLNSFIKSDELVSELDST